jgi:hypothetical protein
MRWQRAHYQNGCRLPSAGKSLIGCWDNNIEEHPTLMPRLALGWTHLPGGVPDADDIDALLALAQFARRERF